MFQLADTLGDQLTDEVERAFKMGEKTVPVGGREIFNPELTNRDVEVFNSAIVDQIGARTGDGENFYTVDPTDGDQLTLTQYKVTISMEVTEMEQEFDKYGITQRLLSAGEGIGTGLAKRMEMDTQQFIKNGGSSSYTDADGNTISTTAADTNSLFNNSHTVNGSSSTFDNLDATAFGQTGIETHLELFRKFMNHDGQRSGRRPNVIYSTGKASLVNLIQEYAESSDHVEDANRGINTYRGKYQHIVLEYLDTNTSGATDTATDDYWGMAIRKGPNMKLRISKMPTVEAPEQVQRNNNILVKGQVWYSVGVHDPIDITLSQA